MLAFPEPTALLIIPDHYIFRMLYSRAGVSMESLGIPTRRRHSGRRPDPRAIWQRFADHYYLFRGTPTGVMVRSRAPRRYSDVRMKSEWRLSLQRHLLTRSPNGSPLPSSAVRRRALRPIPQRKCPGHHG